MDNFIRHIHTKNRQHKIPITVKEINILFFPQRTVDSDSFTVELYQVFKEEIIPIIHKLSEISGRENTSQYIL